MFCGFVDSKESSVVAFKEINESEICSKAMLRPCVETQRTETRWETLTHAGKNMTGIYCVVTSDERAKGRKEREREREPSAALYRDAR